MGNTNSCVSDDLCLTGGHKDEIESTKYQYIGPKGDIHEFSGQLPHSAADELKFVASKDSFTMKPDGEWYLISVEWLDAWVSFAKGLSDEPPGMINNAGLIDVNNPFMLKENVVVKENFRCVCQEVWIFFFEKYGGGPIIYFLVPSGFQPEVYRTGEWLKAAKFAEIARIVYAEAINAGPKQQNINPRGESPGGKKEVTETIRTDKKGNSDDNGGNSIRKK